MASVLQIILGSWPFLYTLQSCRFCSFIFRLEVMVVPKNLGFLVLGPQCKLGTEYTFVQFSVITGLTLITFNNHNGLATFTNSPTHVYLWMEGGSQSSTRTFQIPSEMLLPTSTWINPTV